MGQHLLAVLERLAGLAQGTALAVPHRDHEVGTDEHVDLAGLDGVLLVDVPERLEDQEEAVLVALELGPLVGLDRVLDGQRVQAEDLGDRVQLRLLGLVQPTQTKSSGPHRSRTAARSEISQSTGTRTPLRYKALSTITAAGYPH